jgi:hypothetical protein
MAIGDLFRAKHKHSNPEVRAEAVRQLGAEDRELLVEIARTESDPEIRRLAIERIEDTELLIELAGAGDRAAGDRVGELLVRAAVAGEPVETDALLDRLAASGGDRKLSEVALRAEAATVRRGALRRIREPKIVAEVARHSRDEVVMRKALARIEDPELIASIAMTADKNVGLAALKRITDRDVLQRIAERAHQKAVRRRARQQLVPGEVETRVDPARLAHAERVQLTRRVEKLAGTEDYRRAHEVEEAARRFTELGVGNDAELASRFEKSVARFREGLARSGIKPEPVEPPRPRSAPAPAGPPVAAKEEPVAPVAEGESAAASAPAPAPPIVPPEEVAIRLEAICHDLESIATSDKLKTLNRALSRGEKRFTEIAELPGSTPELLARLDRGRQAIMIQIGEIREQIEWQQWANVPKQEELITRAEALAADEAAGAVGDKLRQLQTDWKAVGPVPRDKAQPLWERFKAACDQVYERVKAERNEQATARKENLARKTELCERAETLADSEDWAETAEALKRLQAEWKSIGPVPRRLSDKLWKRFRGACDRFFERRKPHLEEQLAEHREAIDRKTAIVVAAEALVGGEGSIEDRLSELERLQAEFRRAGKVPPREFHALRTRAQKASAALEAERKQRDAEAEAARAAAEGELAAAVEELAAARDRGETDAAALIALRGRIREHGRGGDVLEAARKRLDEVILAALEAAPEAFAGTEIDPVASRQRREKLCAKVEELVPGDKAAAPQTPEEIAERLRAALADRALGGVLSKRADAGTVKRVITEARESWGRLPPVPGAEGAALEERFAAACRRARDAAR